VGDMAGRMKANASVFAPGVGLNRAVRDFSCIPGSLLDWYHAVFQQGERTMPPSPFDTGNKTPKAALTKRVTISQASGMLICEKIFSETGDPVIKIFPCGAVLLRSGKIVELEKKWVIGMSKSGDCEIVRVENGWLKSESNLFSYIRENTLKEEALALSVSGSRVFRYADRLFLVTEDGLTELTFMLLGKPILSPGNTWGIMAKSMQWFDGIGVQDTVGAKYLVLPFGEKACAHVRAPDLDGMRVVNAKAGNRFATVIALDKAGDYHKFEFALDRDYHAYTLRKEAADGPELNLAILPKGVCASIIEDGTLDIFVPSSGVHKEIKGKQVTTDMALANWGDKVVYIQNGDAWSLKMK